MTSPTQILYARDFQPDGTGVSKADLYEFDSDTHEHILEINEMLEKMNQADNAKLASFMLEQTKINNEVVAYCFRHFADFGKLMITNNGLGLEIGIEAQLKPVPKSKLKF